MADFDRAQREFPSTQWGEGEILDFFDRRPDVVYQIIGDMYDVVKAEEEKARGFVRIGRRPRRSAASMDQVWEALFPEPYSMDPFPEAMTKVLNGRSQRQFAKKIPCHQTTLSRMISGQLEPDILMLERIADAADIHPSFFVEYRALQVAKLIETVLLERPNVGVTAWQLISSQG